MDDGTKFPVISFGHGFVMQPNSYNWLANALVPYGYIVAFAGTETGLPPNHSLFGRDELYIARKIKSYGDSSNSFLYRKTAEFNAVGGHSMGGGASFLAMQNVTDITTFFNFAAAETFITESAIQKAKLCTRPALLLSGTKDCVAPASNNSIKMYQNLASEYKFFANIINGSHCQFADANETPCELGEFLACPTNTYIARNLQQERVMSLLKPWLDFWLKRECNGINTFYTNAANQLVHIDTLQNKVINCNALNVITKIKNQTLTDTKIFPNPSDGIVTISLKDSYQDLSIQLFDVTGKIIDSKQFKHHQEIKLDYSYLEKGIYYLHINSENGTYTSKIVLQ